MPSNTSNQAQGNAKPKPKGPKKKKTTKASKKNDSWYLRLAKSLGTTHGANASFGDFMRTILGLLTWAAFLFTALALLVYVLDAKAIYSQIHGKSPDSNDSGLIGLIGSEFGYQLFNGLFGWGSFIASGILAICAIGLLWLERSQWLRVLGRIAQLLAWTLWTALTLASLQQLFGATDSVLLWGGELGVMYYSTLVRSFGWLGVSLTVIIGLLIILVVCSERVLLAINQPPKLSSEQIKQLSIWDKIKGLFARKPKDENEAEGDEDEPLEDEENHESEEDYTDAEEQRQDEAPAPATPVSVAPMRTVQPQPTATPHNTTEGSAQSVGAEDDSFVVEVAQEDELVAEDQTPQPTMPPGLKLAHYRKPSFDLLQDHGPSNIVANREEVEQTKQNILTTLANFKVQVSAKQATVGPTVTLYEVVPDQGVKVARISSLADDLALNLKSEGIRIIAPMPGQGTVGIEVPNRKPQIVSMRSIIASQRYREEQERMELPIGIGKTITNEPFIFDLAKMPHLLIAGATGQGKSVGLNALITSLLYTKRPEELKFVMVDPKMLEFTLYEDIQNHFMAMLPDMDKAIITDMSLVVPTLNSLCVEMDNRYELLTRARVRNIKDYNEQVRSGKLSRLEGFEFLPYIVLIVDEFADLIMTRGKEVEMPIARLAQKARAAGIHMVIATQRPSTDVITGTIKANFPARIAFKVFSSVDSRTILDSTGANQLVGRGDMLFYQGKEMIRVQCAFLDTNETEDIVAHVAQQESEGQPYLLPEYIEEGGDAEGKNVDLSRRDPLFEDAARIAVSTQMGSTSTLQRKMGIGYARAGRITDQLEAAGIVSAQRGNKNRDVLITDLMALEELLERLRNS